MYRRIFVGVCLGLSACSCLLPLSAIVWQIRAGSVSLLYVSPERFNNERFVSALKGVKVALFVVDEAHCISEVSDDLQK